MRLSFCYKKWENNWQMGFGPIFPHLIIENILFLALCSVYISTLPSGPIPGPASSPGPRSVQCVYAIRLVPLTFPFPCSVNVPL